MVIKNFNTALLIPLLIIYLLIIGCKCNGPTSDDPNADTEAPVITLEGFDPVYLGLKNTYLEAGASAEDNVDGTISVDQFTIDASSIDNTRTGTYSVNYSVSDKAGNKAEKTRSVKVVGENISNITYAGCRESITGTTNSWSNMSLFPNPEEWEYMLKNMSGFYGGNATPSALWIVGEMGQDSCCHLCFPSDGNNHKYMTFESRDFFESSLAHFDTTGVKVFLQVEPGFASITELIDVIMARYGNHVCIAGFGIDMEWYESVNWNDTNGEDHYSYISDADAQAWEAKIKSFNSSYRLYLKHWLTDFMPPTYKGDIIFVNDAQGFSYLQLLVSKFVSWADTYAPNPVMFQIGYDRDKTWWQNYENPPLTVGKAIAEAITNANQKVGIFWVDFTLRDEKAEPFFFYK
jgi:hypothetical protein